MIHNEVKVSGEVEIIQEWLNGDKETCTVKNNVLINGRRALAKSLANDIGSSYSFYITRMLFGDNGVTDSGVKKFVDTGRNGLFGVTRISKPVIANLSSDIETQAIFTSVLAFEEGVGLELSEMALQMANENLYSMTTFSTLTKTSDMQITFNWKINFV